MRYSVFSILREAFNGQQGWRPAWREPDPKPEYDVDRRRRRRAWPCDRAIISPSPTACTNIAVVEKGYIGSGNVGRNTTIIRSNYLLPGNTPFYEHGR